MAEKVTTMVLEVDFQRCCCYKKVKKLLCKFQREIRDQVYDVKNNKVTITVVCCNPERMRDILCCRGGGCIISIKIIPPPPPLPPPQPQVQQLLQQQIQQVCIHGSYGCRCNRWMAPYGVCCSECCQYGGRPGCILQ